METNEMLEKIHLLANNNFSLEEKAELMLPLLTDLDVTQILFEFSGIDVGNTMEFDGVMQRIPGVEALSKPEPDYRKVEALQGEEMVTVSAYRPMGTDFFSSKEKKWMELIVDVTLSSIERIFYSRKLESLEQIDMLTGMPNSDGFLRQIERHYNDMDLDSYAIVYYNLRGFSLVNRRFGGKETNEIIKRYSKIIEGYLSPGECLGHLGGDNFAALIHKSGLKDFLGLIEETETHGNIGSHKVPITLFSNAGVYEVEENTMKEPNEMLTLASIALNSARNISHVPYVISSPEINHAFFESQQMESDFSDALYNEEFVPFFQPKVDSRTNTLCGAEALVRWDRNGRLINPSEFVALFERNGMICDLDFYILEQTCKALSNWVRHDITPVRISINFSRKHLMNPEFANKILDYVRLYDVDTRYLEIELTETYDDNEKNAMIHFLKVMHDNGITVAIDDFGTGYSSLNVLRDFDADVLKIDKSFINKMEPKDRTVLTNIVHLATDLNMEVITEGVSTVEQLEYLNDVNCFLVQGYLYDEPLLANEFQKRLQNKSYDDPRNINSFQGSL